MPGRIKGPGIEPVIVVADKISVVRPEAAGDCYLR